MLWAMIRFYIQLIEHYFVSGHYRAELIIDDQHPHYRRFSKRYKKKQGIVKNVWIAAGLITLAFPFLHVAMILSLVTTFLSFCLLDETK